MPESWESQWGQGGCNIADIPLMRVSNHAFGLAVWGRRDGSDRGYPGFTKSRQAFLDAFSKRDPA